MRLYRQVMTLFLPAALALSALTSCINDNFDNTSGDDLKKEDNTPRKYHIDFLIETGAVTSPLSRDTHEFPDADNAEDGDFVKGSEKEHYIGNAGNYVIFFNADGSFHSVSVLSSWNINNGHDKHPDDKVEAYYRTAEIIVTPENLPSSCIVIVNAQPLSQTILALDESSNISDVTDLIWRNADDPYKIGFEENYGYFTMSNTVYVNNGQLQREVPITPDNVHESGDYDENKLVCVQVERLVAKFTFKETDSHADHIYDNGKELVYCLGFDEHGYPINEPRKWRARVTGWNMNALEREMKVIKQISTNYNFNWNWNDPTYFRSYWAEDPTYGTTDYPWQYRKAVDKALTYYQTKMAGGNTNYLLNLSYNRLNDDEFDKILYLPENTYDSEQIADGLDGRTHLLAGTHLVVCADLEIDVDENDEYRTVEKLYSDRGNVFYTNATDCLWGLVRTFNNVLASQYSLKFQRYDWNGTGSDGETLYALTTSSGTLDDDPYQLYYNGSPLTYDVVKTLDAEQILQDAEIKDGDGKLFPKIPNLTIKNGKGETLKIYTNVDKLLPSNDVLRDAELDYNDILSMMLEWVGAVDHFTDGKMYYAAPAAIVSDTAYGVVRNGWYRYTLSNVNHIGTSVYLPEQPIVPNTVVYHDNLSLTLDILDWHTFTSDIPLPKHQDATTGEET